MAALSEYLLPQINSVLASTFDSFGGKTADAYTDIHGNNSEFIITFGFYDINLEVLDVEDDEAE